MTARLISALTERSAHPERLFFTDRFSSSTIIQVGKLTFTQS